jgi:hypothetical protein
MIKTLQKLLTCALLLSCGLTAQAHIGYGGRDFGALDPSGTTNNTINGQTVSTRFGWADATDADWGDSHRGRFYRFTLTSASYVTITFTGVTGGTAPGLLMPGFTVSRAEVITFHSEPLSRPLAGSLRRHTSLSPACG